MQLISLTICGFGSFANKATIDFERMSGLWLLTGETGAGKTTIFDAITFALFGKDSGSKVSNSSRGLRSDYITDSSPCYVSLEFEQNGTRWLVKRTPTYKKQSNKNETTETAELTGPGETWSKTTDVNRRIIELLGLSAQQFGQLALIAQNDFEKLVLQGSRDRSEIMRNLLKTQRYEAFQKKLRDDKNKLISDVKTQADQLRKTAGDFSWDEEALSSPTVQQYLTSLRAQTVSLVTPQLVSEMLHSITRDEEQDSALMKQKIPLEKRRDDCNRTLGAQEALHRQFMDLETLSNQVSQDEATALRDEQRRKYLTRCDRALQVQPALKDRNRAKKALDEQSAALKNAERQKAEAEHAYNAACVAAGEIRQLEEQKKAQEAEETQKSEALKIFSQLNEISARLKNAQTQHMQLEETKDRLEKQSREQKKKIALLEKSAEKAGELSLRVQSLQHAADMMSQRLNKTKRLQEKENLFNRSCIALKTLAAQQADALEQYRRLHLTFLSNHYAVAVTKLVAGQPCPVCGSPDHPNPYQPPDDLHHVTPEQDRHAQENHEQARKSLLTEENNNKALDQAINDLRAELQLTTPASDEILNLQSAQKENQHQLDEAGRNLQSSLNSQKEMEKAKQEEDSIGTCLTDAMNRLTRSHGAVQKIQGEYEARKASAPQETEEEISARLVWLRQAIEQAGKKILFLRDQENAARQALARAEESVNHTAQSLQKAMAEHAACEENFTVLMAENHFANEIQLGEFLTLSYDELKREQKDLTIRQQERKTRAERKAQLQQLLSDKQDPNPDVLRESLERIIGEIRLLDDKRSSLQESLTRNRDIFSRCKSNASVLAQTEHKLEIYTRLDEIASGTRGKNSTFETYIQRYYFSYVVQLANDRLRRMTDGLLELKMNDSDLDLNVLDHRTGKQRPVRTLSGGEKFKAALSMALGMSDMVRSQVQDVDLGILFIDEGFGTLDSNSIDAAIDLLQSLASDSGRLVAVISHREEMQSGIAQKLFVHKHKEGSREKGSYITWGDD